MSRKPTVLTFFDNREGLMTPRLSEKFFNCEYDPIQREVKTAFFSELRTFAKRDEAYQSGATFLCGCCKGPLKIVGGHPRGKKRFHFMHMFPPGNGDCDFYEGVPYTKAELNAMLFNGRTESELHKSTKALVASAISNEPNIKDIQVEKLIKKVVKTKRKPDIRADFDDKTVVFEVQLSPIYHHVILERNDEYRTKGWYICWIFDNIHEDAPLMRELDAWVNNNYNIFGFDEESRRLTKSTGRLHLVVKYYRFGIIEEGLKSRLAGGWQSETVQFSDLIFDPDSRMVYFHDSMSRKKECEDKIRKIIEETRKKIKEREQIEREKRRAEEERNQLSRFVANIPSVSFPEAMFDKVANSIDLLNEEEIFLLERELGYKLETLDFRALNRWLRVMQLIVIRHNTGYKTAEILWDLLIDKAGEGNYRIAYLSIIDYIRSHSNPDYNRVLDLLTSPIDYEASAFLNSIRKDHKDFIYYTPLILLNRFYKADRRIPNRVIRFFSGNPRAVRCLISAQMGESFGFETPMNLRQVANVVRTFYPQTARPFLYLIERNGLVNLLSGTRSRTGKGTDHYAKLKELVATRDLTPEDLTPEDLDILFPPKRGS